MVYDVLFDKKQPIKIVFLFEHKSFVPVFPHLQLLKYMVRIWEHQLLNKEKLKPIFPFIIYHGKDKWKQKPFEAYFESGEIDETLKPFIPNFDYWLTDLKQSAAKEIEQKYTLSSLRMAFLLMKYMFDKNLDKHLNEIFADWKELIKDEHGKQYLEVVLLYLHQSPKIMEMKEIIEELFTEEDIPEGSYLWEVVETGKKEKATEMAKTALKKKLSIELIIELTGLSAQEIEDIKKGL